MIQSTQNRESFSFFIKFPPKFNREKKSVKAGDIICTQGETGGEHFYLVGAGGGAEVLETKHLQQNESIFIFLASHYHRICIDIRFVKRPKNPGEKVTGIGDNGDYGAKVLEIDEGGSFGELALMYFFII